MNKLILIADDYDHLAQALANVIAAQAKCDTVWALDGRGAIDHAKARRPDLVILNIDMPFVNGIEACRAIRLMYADALPIFAATSGRPITAEVTESGLFNVVMKKPFKLDDLLRLVKMA